jgi:hypothetical protein
MVDSSLARGPQLARSSLDGTGCEDSFGNRGKKKPGVSCLTPAEGIFRIP